MGASGGCGGLQAPALQEVPMLLAEALEAAPANPVGEAYRQPAPRRDPADERVPVILAVPRATTQEHRGILRSATVGPWCKACAPPASRMIDEDFATAGGTTGKCHTEAGWKTPSPPERAMP